MTQTTLMLNRHRDAVEFSNGHIVSLQSLGRLFFQPEADVLSLESETYVPYREETSVERSARIRRAFEEVGVSIR